MKLYNKLYKTRGGWIFLYSIIPVTIILTIIFVAIFTLNAAVAFLIIPAAAVMYISISIPPYIVRARLKATPERRERAKLLDKGQATSYNYYSFSENAYIRRRTFIFEFPDGSRKGFQAALGFIDLSVINDTGLLTYKERNGETLLIGFDADGPTTGGAIT